MHRNHLYMVTLAALHTLICFYGIFKTTQKHSVLAYRRSVEELHRG